MPQTQQQMDALQELYRRRETLDPQKRAAVDELAKRYNIGGTAEPKRSLGASGSWEAPEAPAAKPDTGIIEGVKRGLQHFNPVNIGRSVVQSIQDAHRPVNMEDVKQYEAGLKEFSTDPLSATANTIPFVGPALANLFRRAKAGDTTGAVAEALTATAIGGGIAKLPSVIPTQAKAAGKFESIMAKAKDVPINTTQADAVLARAQELRSRGSTMPKVLNDYAKTRKAAESTGLGREPMTYQAGRDFASNASALSAREVTAMNAKMQAQVSAFAKAMKDANREAAVKVGMGELYDQAMREYRIVKTAAEKAEVIKKWGLRIAGVGVLGKAAQELY